MFNIQQYQGTEDNTDSQYHDLLVEDKNTFGKQL